MILFNFNVLAKPSSTVATRQPDPDGIRLWNMLYQQTAGRLGLVLDDHYERDHFEHWLKVNGIKASLYEPLDTSDPKIKAEKVHTLLASLGRIDWYIDTDPRAVKETMARGVPSMLVATPYVVRPEWEETPGVRPWAEIVEEVDRQNALRAEKDWSKV